MVEITLHLEPRKQNNNKSKVYKLLTRAIYFISIITVLALTTSPAYSEEDLETPQEEIIENVVVVIEKQPAEAAIIRTPIPSPEEKLKIIQENVINIATEQIGTCGRTAVQKYSKGKAAQWCSEFVSWVYSEAGITFSGGQKANPWMLANSQQIEAWFRANNRYHLSKSDYSPKRGDYVQTRNPDGSLHSAIIVDIAQDLDTNQTVFVTIDGNWNGCVEQVEKHTRSNILGFGEIAIQ